MTAPHPPVVAEALEHGWTLTHTEPTHRHPTEGQCAHGRLYRLLRAGVLRQQSLVYEVGPDGKRYEHSTLDDSVIGMSVVAMTDAEVRAVLPQGAPIPQSMLNDPRREQRAAEVQALLSLASFGGSKRRGGLRPL